MYDIYVTYVLCLIDLYAMQCHTKLEEFEKILQNGRQARNSSIEEARNILRNIASCKTALGDLRDEIKRFQEKCKFAKTTGTVTSTAGAALNVGSYIFIEALIVTFVLFFLFFHYSLFLII